MNIPIEYVLPIVVRVSGIFVFVPIFNGHTIPFRIKAGASVLFSVLVFSSRTWDVALPTSELQYAVVVMKESIVGFVLGSLLGMIFAGVQAAGQLISFQMGLSMASSYDPDFGQLEVIGQIKVIFASVLFLLFNGHHALIEALVKSYDIVPLGMAVLSKEITGLFVSSVGFIFEMALRVGGPVIVALWLVSIFLAILNRVIPQMNIFMVEFPVKISLGILSMGLALPFMAEVFRLHLIRFLGEIPSVLLGLKG